MASVFPEAAVAARRTEPSMPDRRAQAPEEGLQSEQAQELERVLKSERVQLRSARDTVPKDRGRRTLEHQWPVEELLAVRSVQLESQW